MQIPDPTPEDEKHIAVLVQPYRKFIRDTPTLLSLLYDIDLLPEQIRLPVNAGRMVAVCELFKKLSPEAVKSLFSPPSNNENSSDQ